MRKQLLSMLPYGILALIILLPLVLPGYVLTLDMVFVPHPPLPDTVTASYPFHAAIHFLSYVIPGDVLQKIILLSIIVGSGIGAHRLVEYLWTNDATQHLASRLAPYAGGILYVINPYVYGRFMAGQYAVLLGYALLPFFVLALLRFIGNPSIRRTLVVAAWAVAISIVSVHTVGLLIIMTIVASAVAIWQRRHDKQPLRDLFSYATVGVMATLVASSYWLVPAMLGRGSIAEQASEFTATDRQAFATDGGVFNVLQLQGFWAEAQQLFVLSGDPLPFSGLWQMALWGVIIIGVIVAWRLRRSVAVLFGIAGALAVILAVGDSINSWLAAHVSFFAGYREPHKFVALLALTYAVFFAYGTRAILVRVRSGGVHGAVIGLVLLPFLVTPTMLWGFNGQLKPVQYPPDWYSVRAQLDQVNPDGKVVFLPWHLYMKFDFSGRIIASPAEKFFGNNVITSNDPEFAGLAPPFDPVVTPLGNVVSSRSVQDHQLGSRLQSLGVDYILLAKESDYKDYDYLDRQTDLQLISDTPTLKLYRNESSKADDHAGN
jgi:hypothetical protein